MYLFPFILIVIGLVMLGTVIWTEMSNSKDSKQFQRLIVVFIDVLLEPITSEGIRAFFGTVIIAIGIILLFQ